MEAANTLPWSLACPRCRAPLGDPADLDDRAACGACGQHYERRDGIWRLLPPARAAYFAPFLRDYTAIRAAEGYGYDTAAHYRRLPEVDPSDPLAWQWRMRAITFAELRARVLRPLGAGLRVLDLGSGVGWLSHRLAQLGHAPCAVDLNLDPRDGLAAARHYPAAWPLLQAEFDRLPLAPAQADVVLFNASLPYSADYAITLAEALRVLRPGGRLVVMDSPIYRRDASGRQMLAERQAAFVRAHGTRADALPSVGYLTWPMLHALGRTLGLRWRAYTPWYGWRWAVRPWRARLLRQREPSTFALLVAQRADEAYRRG